jgi:prevent-host-death family protein
MREIQLRDVKATLSSVVDEAVNGNPSIITRHGHREAVIVSFAEWEKLSHLPSFGKLLMSAPIDLRDLIERDPEPLREIDP